MRVLPNIVLCCHLLLLGACEKEPESQAEPAYILRIPDEVTYALIDTSAEPGVKKTMQVRLNQRVSEEVLRAIAFALKSQDQQHYPKIFILYYLPDMIPGEGAWASTHFTPGLEVKILGMTEEKKQELTATSTHVKGNVIGSWLDERPFVGSRVTLVDRHGRTFVHRAFQDGSESERALIGNQLVNARRYDYVDGSSTGDHWVLDETSGQLELRDNHGLISKLKRIQE